MSFHGRRDSFYIFIQYRTFCSIRDMLHTMFAYVCTSGKHKKEEQDYDQKSVKECTSLHVSCGAVCSQRNPCTLLLCISADSLCVLPVYFEVYK